MTEHTEHTDDQSIKHPYYPQDATINGYVVSSRSSVEILVSLALMVLAVLISAFVIITRTNSSRKTQARGIKLGPLSFADKFAVYWFSVCVFIHLVIEGYFVYFNKDLASRSNLLSDVWREYALSDSRYLTSDPFTVIMEAITAVFDTAMSLLVVYGISNNSSFRHIAQICCSLAQLYGNVIYLTTNYFENFKFTHPDPYYFWFYFVFMNSFWIFFPIYFFFSSWYQLSNSVSISNHVVYSSPKNKKSI
ncbi:3-beta-hydroxysteroid-Delta(8),Delta(7)-isomerase [Smittium culicis]|uniref:3-beta-hydroxysteroid-Delta(8), Delta(7)-isomerase n=1 Tax=Smittium culicis TaxID=133412 RepID=A0A1R1X4U4_9FUNG|nr:3-beta-hydroxysteroid-Delta(8),Delta(7)-isomerase [Smittium culicis]